MAERNPSDDQAAFGVFPQLKRNRSKQDREAAKNVPVDLARGALAGVMGAPGDIESLVRMLPYLDEKTILPTSEDIEKRLPFRSDAPVSRAATGLGSLAGGFYNGPGSPLRVIGALPSAVKRAGQDFALASAAGAPHVVKPSGKGANWLGGQRGSVEAQLGKMKMSDWTTPEEMAAMQKSIDTAKRIMAEDPTVQRTVNQMENELATAKRNNAVNSWIDSNLRNYVKNQMATPDDPVRKLAEEGILHMAPYGEQGVVSSRLMNKRMGLGQDPLGMGRSDPARFWERMSDISVDAYPAGSYKHGSLDESLLKDNPWLQKIPDDTMIYSGKGLSGDLGFDHIIDVLRQDVREGRIRPEQLNKVSMEQAVRRVHEYDQEMAKKMAEAQVKATEGMPVHKEYPEGYRWLELTTPQVATELPLTHVVEPYPSKGVLGQLYRVINPTTGMRGEGYVTPERAIKEFNKGQAEEKLADALKYEGETMGHCVGGYCPDVVAGKSKIYSLRDTKGEPHVTVEVQPNQHLDYNSWFNKQPEEIQNKIAQRRLEDKNHDIYEGPEYLAAREALAPRIVQIKGKQNRAPKEDYLPFVQDFVKSGKWSQIGDLQNTGLIRKSDLIDKFSPDELDAIGAGEYLTKGEHDDLLLKALRPPEGMKRGGKVSISNNPDTMMLEVNNRNMADGGLAKLIRALPKSKAEIEAIAQRIAPQILGEFVRGDKGTQSVAGKTQKQFAKEKEMVHDIRPTGAERPLPKPVDIESLKGNVVIGIPGDPTISGQTLHSLNGIPLDSPSPQHGGPLYGLGRDDAFWASGLGAANRVQNLAREAGQQYDAPVLGKYIMMGPESINYAQHYTDANLSAINPAKMTKEQIDSFNNLVREGYPYVKNKERYQRVFPAFPGIENPSEAYLHFSIDPELRKHFNALMQMPTVTEKHALPSGIDVRHAITEPDLRDLETGVTGKSIGRMRPEITQLGLSEHPTYSHDIPGDFMGSSKYPMPYELSFPDTVRAIRENPKQAPHEFGSLKMVGPRQVIDQQMIDEIKQYEEQMKRLTGKKKGGAIKKAAGGAITGDDLIIEERPL